MRQGSIQNLEPGTLLEGGYCGVRSCSSSTFAAEGVWPAIETARCLRIGGAC